jgi:hypothetical protein
MPHLDKELCDPHLARGMTRIRDDVQSDLGPYLLQFPCRRRLFWSDSVTVSYTGGRQFLRKDNGQLRGVARAYRAYDVVPSLHDRGRNMAAAYRSVSLDNARTMQLGVPHILSIACGSSNWPSRMKASLTK